MDTPPVSQRLGALEDVIGASKEPEEEEVRADNDNDNLREENTTPKDGETSSSPTRKRPKTEPLALATLGNDATVHIASFLGAKGIACLAQTCRRFGRGHLGADGQVISLAGDLAKRVFDGSATDYEKSVLTVPRDNPIKLLHELELMRSPLCFEQLIGSADVIRYPLPGDHSIVSLLPFSGESYATAISDQVMRVGRHYVTFHIADAEEAFFQDDCYLDFGVIRPIKDWDKKGLQNFDPLCYELNKQVLREPLLSEKTDDWGEELHCCSYHSEKGKCWFVNWNDEDEDVETGWEGEDWEGKERTLITVDLEVGLLLDLDSGTLSVFKNDRKLGVMKEGFTGAYCWFVGRYDGSGDEDSSKFSIKIKRGMPPVE